MAVVGETCDEAESHIDQEEDVYDDGESLEWAVLETSVWEADLHWREDDQKPI